MLLFLAQSASLLTIAGYLAYSRFKAKKRLTQSWETLLGQLRSDWSARDLSDHFLWKEGTNASPADAWQRLDGPRGLWAIYQNAGVMQQMADYAEQHSTHIDKLLLETLRSDAMQIRLCVWMALAQYAFSHASEGVRINAYRAASLYTDMAARMTRLLQESDATIVPSFVAAM